MSPVRFLVAPQRNSSRRSSFCICWQSKGLGVKNQPCVPGSIPGGTTEELLTQEFFLYMLVEQRTGRKNPALCPRFDSWWHHRTVYHNNSSAAFFIGFGLGYKPQYIPCVFILSALHVGHSDASSRAYRNIHFNTAPLPLWFSGR